MTDITLNEQRKRNLLIACFKNESCNVSLKVTQNKGSKEYYDYVLSLVGDSACFTYDDLRQTKSFGFTFGRVDIEKNTLIITFVDKLETEKDEDG